TVQPMTQLRVARYGDKLQLIRLCTARRSQERQFHAENADLNRLQAAFICLDIRVSSSSPTRDRGTVGSFKPARRNDRWRAFPRGAVILSRKLPSKKQHLFGRIYPFRREPAPNARRANCRNRCICSRRRKIINSGGIVCCLCVSSPHTNPDNSAHPPTTN